MLTKYALFKADEPDVSDLDEFSAEIVRLLKENPEDEDLQFAFELATIQSMLMDLSVHSPKIYRKARELNKEEVDKRRRVVVKALAKHAQSGTITPEMISSAKEFIEKGRRIRVAEHERSDGTKVEEHWRVLPDGKEPKDAKTEQQYKDEKFEEQKTKQDWALAASQDFDDAQQRAEDAAISGFEDIGESAGEAVSAPYITKESMINAMAAAPDRITNWSKQTADGMEQFLDEETWGRRLINGAEYLADTGLGIAKTAKVVSHYGPFVGMRMMNTYARYGGYDVPVPEPGTKGAPPEGASADEVHNWAVNRLVKRLPGRQEYQLAGENMPSEGFFINRDGEVKAHAVGRGRDHFIPFGLSHLKQMKSETGGEMVRRRAAGGITTEDLHVGMMMGLDRVTVVSNSGKFTISLTDRAKGLRSEHMQILGRYQELVDARGGGRGRAGFDAYDVAMGALSLEFPLHFKKTQVTRGPDADGFRDKAVPDRTLVDELRELAAGWNPLDRGKNRKHKGHHGHGHPQQSRDGQDWRKVASSIGFSPSPHETQREFLDRLRQRNPQKFQEFQGRMGWDDQPSQRGAGQQTAQQLAQPIKPKGQRPQEQNERARREGDSDTLSASDALGGVQFQPAGSTDTSVRTSYMQGSVQDAKDDQHRQETKQRLQRAAQDVAEAQDPVDADPNITTAQPARIDPSEGQYQSDGVVDPDRPIEELDDEPTDDELLMMDAFGEGASNRDFTDAEIMRLRDAVDAGLDGVIGLGPWDS